MADENRARLIFVACEGNKMTQHIGHRHSDEIAQLNTRLAEAMTENAAYRRAYGCLACGEDHPTNVICPPHECRTTGMAWYVEKMRAAVARAERAEGERDELRRELRKE